MNNNITQASNMEQEREIEEITIKIFGGLKDWHLLDEYQLPLVKDQYRELTKRYMKAFEEAGWQARAAQAPNKELPELYLYGNVSAHSIINGKETFVTLEPAPNKVVDEDVVKKVARAIFESVVARANPKTKWQDVRSVTKKLYLDDAKAAIEAMRGGK